MEKCYVQENTKQINGFSKQILNQNQVYYKINAFLMISIRDKRREML